MVSSVSKLVDGPRCCTLLALATLRGRQAVESETTPPAERGASRFPAASVAVPPGGLHRRQCESSLRRSAGPRLFQRLFRVTGSSFGSLARWQLCTYSHAATRRRKSKAANEPSAYTTLLGCGVPPRAQACTRSVQYSFDRSQTPTADLTAGARPLVQGSSARAAEGGLGRASPSARRQRSRLLLPRTWFMHYRAPPVPYLRPARGHENTTCRRHPWP